MSVDDDDGHVALWTMRRYTEGIYSVDHRLMDVERTLTA